jgi:hypothetical protein
MEYRLYLLGADDRIRAAESFLAENDTAAIEVASAVFGCCSTDFPNAEVWRGPQRLTRISKGIGAAAGLRQLMDRRQENVAQLEELLERSFACVRESRELMAHLDRIRRPKLSPDIEREQAVRH